MRKPTNSSALCAELLGTSKVPKRVVHFYLSIVRCHLGYATQVWSSQSIGLLHIATRFQLALTKLILKLPFRCDVTYKTRLQLTNLLPISYWYGFLDIVFFYKAVNNLVFIDVKLCLKLDNQRDLPGHRAAMLLFISLCKLELLLINAHFSYARAAHGMFCPLSYVQVKSL